MARLDRSWFSFGQIAEITCESESLQKKNQDFRRRFKSAQQQTQQEAAVLFARRFYFDSGPKVVDFVPEALGNVEKLLNCASSEGTQKYSESSLPGRSVMTSLVTQGFVKIFGSIIVRVA